MQQDHYEINVSKARGLNYHGEPHYVHFFATAERSCVTAEQMREVHAEIVKAFPAPAYKVTVMKIECRGQYIEVNG